MFIELYKLQWHGWKKEYGKPKEEGKVYYSVGEAHGLLETLVKEAVRGTPQTPDFV